MVTFKDSPWSHLLNVYMLFSSSFCMFTVYIIFAYEHDRGPLSFLNGLMTIHLPSTTALSLCADAAPSLHAHTIDLFLTNELPCFQIKLLTGS